MEADMKTDFPESKASWCCCRVEIHRYTSCWNWCENKLGTPGVQATLGSVDGGKLMAKALRLGVAYDFRNPSASGMSHQSLYAAIMDQVAWLDGLGLDLVWFTEHHFVEDGYLPSWIPVASAMAARTRHVRFSCDVCLLPFNHPIRLAEDLAVLDNISGGRVEIGVGMGYAPHEFRGFGLPVSRRVSLTDEGIAVLRRAFTGEKFSFAGKRYDFQDVTIKPGYVQPGGPPLWVAAMSEAGALRAARVGANLLPQGPRAPSLDAWAAALRADGRDPAAYRIGIIRSCLVTDDRERDWGAVRIAERRRMEVYNRFREEAGGHGGVAGITDEQRIPQTWVVGNVDHCVAELAAFIEEYGLTDIVTWAVPPGMRPEEMSPSLERFARDVAPRLRARFGGPARRTAGDAV
jgi:alkanesulfonate monooxygenase SsuD/methylene tetrahydromethanopterin reductase-like flavin-dependent oxidoreductase (luciferase family)